MIFERVARKIRRDGVAAIFPAIKDRIFPQRFADFRRFRTYFNGKIGLEIGGPSAVFGSRGILPIYPVVARLDNCTFSRRTMWEGQIAEGRTFMYDSGAEPGQQYIIEGGSLDRLPSSTYDFVISSHVIEHLANPLRGLSEWIRVLKTGGLFVMVVPHKDGTFDHRRPVTSFDHLLSDLEGHVGEDDMTHLDEILRLHDLSRDPGAGDFETFRTRAVQNAENRGLHHHVFDTRLAVKMVEHVQLQILDVQHFRPFHIAIVAQKSSQPPARSRSSPDAQARRGKKSPFPSDNAAAFESSK